VQCDVLLQNARVVDPRNGVDGQFDLAISDEVVCGVERKLEPQDASEVYDVSGMVVMPGVIDLHVHTSRRHKGYNAHRMMARAGVVTALDLGGPLDEFLEFCRNNPAGLNMAALQAVRPGHTTRDEDPGPSEIADVLQESVERGALGLKILGGHYPLTPEATRRIMEVCNEHRKHVAFHSGTTRTPGNVDGLLESIDLAEGLRLHLPHINSYCRGAVRGATQEISEALEALQGRENLFTEAYLAIINGTSGRCTDGLPESLATRRCLEEGGYEATQEGLRRAIIDGYARVGKESSGENINVTGEEALEEWKYRDTVVSVNFPVNPAEGRLLCAVARDDTGDFIVDAISTDGGGHPRNVAVECGLALVRTQGLTMNEFVQKTSWMPAEIIGLPGKGHLAPGADGDVTVVDPERCRPVMSFNRGRLIMHRGAVVGNETTVITTEHGRKAIQDMGLRAYTADTQDGIFYADDPRAALK